MSAKILMRSKLKLERIISELEEINNDLGDQHISGVGTQAIQWVVMDINAQLKKLTTTKEQQ